MYGQVGRYLLLQFCSGYADESTLACTEIASNIKEYLYIMFLVIRYEIVHIQVIASQSMLKTGGIASPSTVMLSEVPHVLKITIVGGSISERSGDKVTFKESKTLTAGKTPTVVDTEVGCIGIGICFDIRFQESTMFYTARVVHLICCPGAFNMTTGPLHWELLQKAR
ncbi:hypothetical protein Nepgr_024722 [Nepenthes gracilis]|uniref:CN hydrolase domain-containing protein n=1 Tax=Nepenthes gracilis TaxID=150966 RepID=A0AAD3T5N1_NEPGR|nr:hypothetical protein Nepgr_024722 [Nepenthes gracilis]